MDCMDHRGSTAHRDLSQQSAKLIRVKAATSTNQASIQDLGLATP